MTAPERDPSRERAFGAGFVLALHVAFTALTWVVGTALPLQDFSAAELLQTWLMHLGLVQGVYVIPAVLTTLLLQRYQMAVGMGVLAGLTLIGTAISMV